MRYDHITRDLARKAGDDACGAIFRAASLTPDLDAKIQIALFAAGAAMAIPASWLAMRLGTDPEATADALWCCIRPMIMDVLSDPEARHG